jgi:hypothetical protein
MQKVIARFTDGHLLKGFTSDFNPVKDSFHLSEDGAPGDTTPVVVQREGLKALFFVRDFAGNANHDEAKDFDPGQRVNGRKIRVTFKDGEVLIGTTLGYQKNRPGFFLESVDEESNIERCYVVTSATEKVTFEM